MKLWKLITKLLWQHSWKFLLLLFLFNFMLRSLILSENISGESSPMSDGYLVSERLQRVQIGRELDQVDESEIDEIVNSGQDNPDLILWHPYVSTDAIINGSKFSSHDSSYNEVSHWIEVYPVCADYFLAGIKPRRVHPYFYGKCAEGLSTLPITLAIQMDLHTTYWEKLQYTASHWTADISVALYIAKDDNGLILDLSALKKIIQQRFQKFNLDDSTVCVHLLVDTVNAQTHNYFPVNTLRNIATKYSRTKYVLNIEADFIPMPGLANHLYTEIKSWNTSLKAFVIPAYTSYEQLTSFPTNKQQLLREWNKNKIVPIWYPRLWKAGHKSTLYHLIKNTSHVYEVNHTRWYEPYYVVERNNSPFYPEDLLFGLKDKIAHATLLNRLKYQFYVLPEVYIVHTPHESNNHTLLSKAQERCAGIAFNNLVRKMNQLGDSKTGNKKKIADQKNFELWREYKKGKSDLRRRPEYIKAVAELVNQNNSGIVIYKSNFKPVRKKKQVIQNKHSLEFIKQRQQQSNAMKFERRDETKRNPAIDNIVKMIQENKADNWWAG